MISNEKLTSKLSKIKSLIEEIGHVPTLKENENLYKKIKYYYNNYPDSIIIQELKNKYPLPTSNRRQYIKKDNIDSRLKEIEVQLKKLGRIPKNSENVNLLHEINRYYRIYPDNPLVQRLKAIYPTNSLYSKWGKISDNNQDTKETITLSFGFNCRTIESPYSRAKTYIYDCVNKYNELPGLKTWPMHFFYEKLKTTYHRAVDKEVLKFAKYLIEDKKINNEYLIQTYYESSIDEPFIYDRLKSIMDKHKIVTLGYLSRNLVPGLKLNKQILYHYFYYQDQNKGYSYGVKEKNRHKYRLFETCYGGGGIVSIDFNELIKLDFNKIADSIPFNVLPEYTEDIDNELDLQISKAFLFHQDTEFQFIDNKPHYKNNIDFNKTIFDDLANGICPIKFLRDRLFYDNPEISIDWCLLLIRLNSPIIKKYIYNDSLTFNIKDLPDTYKKKLNTIKDFVFSVYNYQIKFL